MADSKKTQAQKENNAERARPAQSREVAPTLQTALPGPQAALLRLQRAAGNQAVSRLVQAGGGALGTELPTELDGELGDQYRQEVNFALGAAAAVTPSSGSGVTRIGGRPEDEEPVQPPSERQEEEEPQSTRQPEEASTRSGSTAYAPSPAQIQWGKGAKMIGDYDRASLWSRQPTPRPGSPRRSPWGASAGARGATRPQPVAWGAIQNIGDAGQEDMGAEISGPPAGTGLLTIQGHAGDPDTHGWTFFPKKFRAPNFEFNTIDMANLGILRVLSKTPLWYALPKQTDTAFEGDADAFFPNPGTHKTQHQEGGVDVFWKFSGPISARIETAEQEHCDDHAHAYKISLEEAEDVLQAHVHGKHFGPKPTEAAVKQMVLDEIKNNLTHPKLGNDKTRWAAKYNTLFRMTGERDRKGWHTLPTKNRRVVKDNKGNPVKVIYDVVKGASKIGVVDSKKVIKYV